MGDGKRWISRSSLEIRPAINLILGTAVPYQPKLKLPKCQASPLGISLKNSHPCDTSKVCGKPRMRLLMPGESFIVMVGSPSMDFHYGRFLGNYGGVG
jgi:hypothetical protein